MDTITVKLPMGRTRTRLKNRCENTPAEECFGRRTVDLVIRNEAEYEALIGVSESLDDMGEWANPRSVWGYKANKRVLAELREAYGEENEED